MSNTMQLLTTPEEVSRVISFVRRYPLSYPDYDLWLDKCSLELERGYKKSFYITDEACAVVGSVIFQPHKQERNVLEPKNLRISPEYEQGGMGSSLVALMELYAREHGFMRIMCDVDPEAAVLGFLQERGYKVEAHESLYTARREIVLVKDL